ncbi:MAG TPA: hypothetical protein VD770_02120, partial [Coxiellaceae bacterium]|nr:hypothetical protein [Coxiellaceae bacterium]
PSLRHGLWIMKDQLLLTLVNPHELIIEGIVSYQYHDLITQGLAGIFIPANLDLPKFKVKIANIDYNNPVDFSIGHGSNQVGYLTEAVYPDTHFYHLSSVGGDIAATADNQDNFKPLESQYRVYFVATSEATLPTVIERGVVLLEVEKPSFFTRTWRAVSFFLIGESGF